MSSSSDRPWVGTVLLDLVLPTRCAACGGPRGPVCSGCFVGVQQARHPGGARRVRPDPEPAGFPLTIASARLEQPLRGLLTAYKDLGRRDLAPLLAPLLAEAVRAAAGRPCLLVPVPASRRSRRVRGDRPLEQLCLAAAALLPEPTRVVRALEPCRDVRDQSGLDHRARAANVSASMRLRPGAPDLLTGAPVVLVDDIVTTGATLVEAARRLGAPARPVLAAVVASTTRKVVGGRGPD